MLSRGRFTCGCARRPVHDVKIDGDKTRLPVIDLTPSPAISSFVVYRGTAFPEWDGDLITGSLKGNTLFRFRVDEGGTIERETLIEGIGRIRDVEVNATGDILLLIENANGGKILLLRPDAPDARS